MISDSRFDVHLIITQLIRIGQKQLRLDILFPSIVDETDCKKDILCFV